MRVTYRKAMAELGQIKTPDPWYEAMDADRLLADIKDPEFRQRALKRLQKERAKSLAEDIFPKLAETTGGMPLIKDQLSRELSVSVANSADPSPTWG